jgi:hypothetical protein
MRRERIFEIAASIALVLSLAIALAELASRDGDAWIWFVLIALGPAAHAAFAAIRGLADAPTPEDRLRVIVGPRTSRSFALSFLLLGVVVGAAIRGGWGAIAGAAIGGVAALQTLVAMKHIRRALQHTTGGMPEDEAWEAPHGARYVIGSVLGLGAGVVLVAAVGYATFGLWGAVLLAAPLLFLFAAMWIAAARRARAQLHDDVSIL